MAEKPKKKRNAMSREQREAVKFSAEVWFTLSVSDCSVASMTRVPQFQGLTQETLQRWAAEGNWLAKRQANQDKLRDMLRHRLANSLVEDRVRALEDHEWICEEGLSWLDSPEIQPKGGFEGVAGTVLNAMKNMEAMRKDVVLELSGGAPQTTEIGATHLDGDISPEEAQAAARALLEVRQKALRAMPVANDPGAGA